MNATSSGGQSYGLFNAAAADGSMAITIEGSRIGGATNTIDTLVIAAGSFTVRVATSGLFGGPVSGGGTCAGVYDENFAFSASTCP